MVLGKAPESKAPTLLKIDNKWVNVEIWKQMHPGGAAPLERYAGKDCTDAFMALHSREALNQVLRMKAVDVPRDVAEQVRFRFCRSLSRGKSTVDARNNKTPKKKRLQ